MRTIAMSRKLHRLPLLQLQHIFQPPPKAHQDLPRLVRAPTLPACHIALAPSRHTLPHCLRPQADSVKAFTHIDDDAHDFAVLGGGFEGLADGGEHDMQPEFVDGDGLVLFELVGPFTAMFVLRVFPFGADAFFEEVIVGFEG